MQLREKQEVKAVYGLQERQLRRYFAYAWLVVDSGSRAERTLSYHWTTT